MSIPAFGWALQQGHEHNLTPSERLVLIFLADQLSRTGRCCPGQPTIRKFTGLAIDTIRLALKKLASVPLIRIREQPGLATTYDLLRETNPTTNGAAPPNHSATPPINGGATPPNHDGVMAPTPLNGGGVTPPIQGANPPDRGLQPPRNVAPTLKRTKKENPKTCAGAHEASQDSDSDLVGRKSDAAPTEAEVKADRERSNEKLKAAGDSGIAVLALARSLRRPAYAPGAWPSEKNQAATAAALAAISGRPNATLSGEHLKAMRAQYPAYLAHRAMGIAP